MTSSTKGDRLRVVGTGAQEGEATARPPRRFGHTFKHFATAPAGWTAWVTESDERDRLVACPVAGFAVGEGGETGDFLVPLTLQPMESVGFVDPRTDLYFICLTAPQTAKSARARALMVLGWFDNWHAWRHDEGQDACTCETFDPHLCTLRRNAMKGDGTPSCDCDCHTAALGLIRKEGRLRR